MAHGIEKPCKTTSVMCTLIVLSAKHTRSRTVPIVTLLRGDEYHNTNTEPLSEVSLDYPKSDITLIAVIFFPQAWEAWEKWKGEGG